MWPVRSFGSVYCIIDVKRDLFFKTFNLNKMVLYYILAYAMKFYNYLETKIIAGNVYSTV